MTTVLDINDPDFSIDDSELTDAELSLDEDI